VEIRNAFMYSLTSHAAGSKKPMTTGTPAAKLVWVVSGLARSGEFELPAP
jgi:hypothetical protein